MDDKYNPHDKSSTEKAEGSRENLDVTPPNVSSAGDDRDDVNKGSATTERMERGSGQVSQPDKPIPSTGGGGAGGAQANRGAAQRSAGITNRPPDEEERNQDELPPRGAQKSERD
jgi:hypothetical protein